MPSDVSLSPKQKEKYNNAMEMIKRITNHTSTIKTEVYSQKYPLDYYNLVERVVSNFDIYKEICESNEFMADQEIAPIVAAEILEGKIKHKKWQEVLSDSIKGKELKKISKNMFCRLTSKEKGVLADKYGLKKTEIPFVFEIPEDFDRTVEEFRKNFIFQNLSSCLPAYILNPDEESTVIDCCAAPGNKTTHLSSIMNNKGHILAVERNKVRFNTLKQQVKVYNCKNVKCLHSDFLKVKIKEVDYILLDPPCSGSGIHFNYEKDQKRVDSLHNLQVVLLKHALAFNPKRIVYSTCSEFDEEGEAVIKEILEKNDKYEVENIEIGIGKRGCDGYEFSSKVIRMDKSEKHNGFFVALLKRK